MNLRRQQSLQQNFFNKHKNKQAELLFVDSMYEMWKLRWLIIQSKNELLHTRVLKKYRHQDGSYIFDRSCSWRCSTFEKLLKPLNEERNRKALKTGSLQLFEIYFLQYYSLLFNCEIQYLKFINLEI